MIKEDILETVNKIIVVNDNFNVLKELKSKEHPSTYILFDKMIRLIKSLLETYEKMVLERRNGNGDMVAIYYKVILETAIHGGEEGSFIYRELQMFLGLKDFKQDHLKLKMVVKFIDLFLEIAFNSIEKITIEELKALPSDYLSVFEMDYFIGRIKKGLEKALIK